MSLFASILETITNRLKTVEYSKQEIATIISESIGVTVTPDQIKVQNQKLFLLTSPTIKTTLLIKKEKLLLALKSYNITSIN